MHIQEANYAALKAFERSPGSAKRHGEVRPLDQTQSGSWAGLVRDELASARLACGPERHKLSQLPASEYSEYTPSLHYESSTTRSTETWTHPEKNAFVQVKDERTNFQSEGLSSGRVVYDSCGSKSEQRTTYGIETEGYIAGMRIFDRGHASQATAFKIDKRHPEKSWITQWNIR